jgi:DNA end-binding protein Ku
MAALKASLDRVRAGAGAGGGDGGGDGNGDDPGGDDLDDLSRDELYERAQDAEIPGRSSMSKKELIDALSG